MQFRVSRIEPGEDPGHVVVTGDIVQMAKVIVPVDGSPATVKQNMHGICESRVNDALAGCVADAARGAMGEPDRGTMVKKGREWVRIPRDPYTAEPYDNSLIGKMSRVLSGQEFQFLPPPSGDLEAMRARALPAVDSVGIELPPESQAVVDSYRSVDAVPEAAPPVSPPTVTAADVQDRSQDGPAPEAAAGVSAAPDGTAVAASAGGRVRVAGTAAVV